MMKIITGTAKGTKLETLEGETTRPTAEKTKMAIFNTLQFDIEGRRVLDLFGGSGQLALEALSRGASSAFICESDLAAFEIIKKNAQKTKLFSKIKLVCSDYKSALRSLSGKDSFGLIFLDPPYKSTYLNDAVKKIMEGNLLSKGGFLVCECENSEPVSYEGLKLYKHAKYGRAYVTILYNDPDESEGE